MFEELLTPSGCKSDQGFQVGFNQGFHVGFNGEFHVGFNWESGVGFNQQVPMIQPLQHSHHSMKGDGVCLFEQLLAPSGC